MRFLFLSTLLFIEANSLVMSQNSRAAAKKPKSSHNVPPSGVRADDVERCVRPRDVKKDALDSWSTSLSADVNDASAQFIIDEVKAHAKETVPNLEDLDWTATGMGVALRAMAKKKAGRIVEIKNARKASLWSIKASVAASSPSPLRRYQTIIDQRTVAMLYEDRAALKVIFGCLGSLVFGQP